MFTHNSSTGRYEFSAQGVNAIQKHTRACEEDSECKKTTMDN